MIYAKITDFQGDKMNPLISHLIAEGLWRLAVTHDDNKGILVVCMLITPDAFVKWVARHRNKDKSAKGEAIAAIEEAIKAQMNHPPD